LSSSDARLKRLEQHFSLGEKGWQPPSLQYGFWCGHYLRDGQVIPDGSACCFWHWRGLPKRWGQRHPLYSWQEDILRDLQNGVRYFYILKPPKIGATEFWLSYAEDQALNNIAWRNGEVAIVVGTGLGESEGMISRAKGILEIKDIEDRGTGNYKVPINERYNTRKEFTLNTVLFKAYPADNKGIDAVRNKPNMKLILIDEGAFFRIMAEQQQKVKDAAEHYIGGADVIIVFVSTAGDVPAGFMYDIEREEPSIYKKYILDYHVGLEVHPESFTSLYRKDDIDLIKDDPSFQRNYMHQWGHGSGDIFDVKALELCTVSYPIKHEKQYERVLDVDPGYGSSKSGLVGFEQRDGIPHVIQAAEYSRPSQTELISIINNSITYYGYMVLRIDAANPGLIEEFKPKITTQPINFRERGQIMTDNASIQVKQLQVKIELQFEELLRQLRAAKKNEKGTIDKKLGTFDLYDPFIMGLDYFANNMDYKIRPINRKG